MSDKNKTITLPLTEFRQMELRIKNDGERINALCTKKHINFITFSRKIVHFNHFTGDHLYKNVFDITTLTLEEFEEMRDQKVKELTNAIDRAAEREEEIEEKFNKSEDMRINLKSRIDHYRNMTTIFQLISAACAISTLVLLLN